MDIRELYKDINNYKDKEVVLEGWVRNNRAQKEFGFLDLNDGTHFNSVQVVYEDSKIPTFKEVQKYRAGVAVKVKGLVELTPNSKQLFEIKAVDVELLGDSQEDYPIQPKRHTREFLRENAHLRSRTKLFNAVFRVRSLAAHAIHSFFQEKGFIYVHTPILTANDGEGAGETFTVTTLSGSEYAKEQFDCCFFNQKVNLAVTGQLEAEAFALSFKNVYTFGPTFRAENSNTSRHAAEFWMIEPEFAFADLNVDMDIAEEMVKYAIDYVTKNAPDEIDFFNQFVSKGLKDKLNNVLNSSFKRITHKEAIDVLLKANIKFENKPDYKEDLATEHEKYLTEHFSGPVFVTDWPKDIKAFYMRLNDDNETVAAMDLLVPGSGELIGGSQREERIDILTKRMKDMDIPEEDLEWYLDLRKYGGCKHSGFGMGFERLVMYLTGVENIRDVLPFPRTPGNCEF